MGLNDVVDDLYAGISLQKAVTAVFGLDENPETNAVGIERFIPDRKSYVLKSGIEVERYSREPDIFILNDSINVQLSNAEDRATKEVATFCWSDDCTTILLSYDYSNSLDISIIFPRSYTSIDNIPNSHKIRDPLYSPNYFFQLTRLFNINDLMDICNVSMEVVENDVGGTSKVNYKINNIPSQQLLSVFVEYIHSLLFSKDKNVDGSFNLFKNLRKYGIFLPSAINIDMKAAIDDCFPAAKFYSEIDHRWLSAYFGKKGHPYDPVKSYHAIGVDILSNLGIPTHPDLKELESVHVTVSFQEDLLPNVQQRYAYGLFLVQELRKRGFESDDFAEYETFAFWDGNHLGREIDLEFNLPATSQRQLEDLFSAFERFYHKVEHTDSDTLLERLLAQNITEQDAYAMIEAIHDDFKAVDIVDHQSDKNKVYYLQDRSGNKKVIKVMADQNAAKIETLVLTAFAKHPVLSKYVPRCYTAEPIAIAIEQNLKYITIQEDIRRNEEQLFESMLFSGNRKQVVHYLASWVKTLANIHHYGTQIVNDINCVVSQKNISRFASERHEERIISSHLVYDSGLRNAIFSASIEQGSDFIHGDLRFENRLGTYAIDWDHAARGNPLMDLVQLFVDPRLNWMRFSEQEQKQFISLYLSERKKIESEDTGIERKRVSAQEIEHAYFEFAALRVLYTQSQAAYLLTLSDLQQNNQNAYPNSLSLQNARETAAFLRYKLPAFEEAVRRI